MNKYRVISNKWWIKAKALPEKVLNILGSNGDEIVKEAGRILEENAQAGNDKYFWTGALQESLNYKSEMDGDDAVLTISAPAEHNGVEYAQFVEFGTGIHNEFGDGRTTPWRWKDKYGQWHTTTGYEARPFIRPAVEAQLPKIIKEIKDAEL